MDHNDFLFDEDFVEPLMEFFSQINLKVYETVSDLQFEEEYYFPNRRIINYEKTFMKSSIIWEIMDERDKLDKEH